MNVKVHGSELNRMMKIVTQCIDQLDITNKANVEISHNDNLLTIRATNGHFSASMSTPALGSEVEKFCVDGNMFAKVASMSNGDVNISTDGKDCIVNGTGRTKLPIVYTTIPETKRISGLSAGVAGGDFVHALNGVLYAVSNDQTPNRIVFTGILMEINNDKMRIVGLDGFQMSIEEIDCIGDNMRIVVPANFMKLVAQAAAGEDISFVTDGRKIEANTVSMVLSCGLITGEYIDYNRILPTEFSTESLLNVSSMHEVLKNSSIIDNKQNLIKLEVGENDIHVTNNGNKAEYEADVACLTNGKSMNIAFNLKYLLTTISTIPTDEVTMKFTTPVSPCILQGKGERGFRLLLPVKVRETCESV